MTKGVSKATYRRWGLDMGGNYTFSRSWGNVEGETVANGPTRFEGQSFPEYKQAAWNYPTGNLASDQPHRSRLWLTYTPSFFSRFTASVIQIMESGVHYGAGGREATANPNASGVDTRPYVTNPGYLVPPVGNTVSYFYTARDAFRTQGQMRTDLGLTYNHRVGGGGGPELYVQLHVVNLFNQFQLCACGGTAFGTGSSGNAGGINIQRLNTAVLTPVTTPARFATFNPFTTTPVRGVNYDLGPILGLATSRFAYTTPQSMRLLLGVRF